MTGRIQGRLLLRGAGTGAGGAAGHIDLAAFRADGRVVGHRLGDDFPVLPLSLGLFPDHMLLLVAADGRCRQLRRHIGGGFEGYPGIVRAVLILPLLTGLALASSMTSWADLDFSTSASSSSGLRYWMRPRTDISTGRRLPGNWTAAAAPVSVTALADPAAQ